jgi:phage baseplate assembly protein gpV
MSGLFGKFRGRVEDNTDPLHLGRVRVSSPTGLGEGVSDWAMPCVPYAGPGVGFLMMPPVGAGVWVEFEEGEMSRPIWTGCFWAPGEEHEAASGDVTIAALDGTCVTLDSAGNVDVRANATVKVYASEVRVSAGTIALDTGTVTTPGAVRCDTLIANSVVASSYTPGVGNLE